MSGPGKRQAVVFLRERLASRGAAGKRDAELAGESRGKGFCEQRLEQGGILLVSYIEEANLFCGAVYMASSQSPARAAYLQHTQAIQRQGMAMHASVTFLGCGQGSEHGGKAPSVGAEDFPAYRVVVHVAKPGSGGTIGGDGVYGGFAQFGEGEITDVERGGRSGWWIACHIA